MRCAALPAALLAAALVNAAPVRAADHTCPGAAQGFQRLKDDDLEFAFRWDPAVLKVGQFFAAEVVACSVVYPPSTKSEFWERGRIEIDATMPAHGHGMNYRPKAERIGAGHYRFTGLMLHMPGTWRFTFAISSSGGDVYLSLGHDVDLKQ